MKPVNDPEIGLFYNVVEGSSIALVVHDVVREREDEFLEWQRGITRVASSFPGYQRTLLFEPKPEAHSQWITSIHFESSEQLDAWLESDVRKKWLDENPAPFPDFKVEKTTMGLENWFQREGSAPPDWRMVMAVVLALYPTMIILTVLVNPFLPTTSFAFNMLIGNIFGVAVLQWIGMPIVNRCFGWWLAPFKDTGWGKSVAGFFAISLILAAFYALYLYLTPGLTAGG